MQQSYKLLAIIFLLGIFSANAQELSPAGHIIIPQKNIPVSPALKNTQQTSTWLTTSSGFLSIDANYENAPAFISIYADDASLLQRLRFDQCINSKLSDNKKYFAFYNRGYIHVLNLENFEEEKFLGSTFFELNNAGEISFMHSNASSIYVDATIIEIPSTLISIKNINNQWHYITKQGIYVYADGTMHLTYTPTQGILFDAAYYQNTWYLSTRTKTKEVYQFKLFSTKNLNHNTLKLIDTKNYARVYANNNTPENIDPKFANRNNELIKNPMDFFSTASFQAIGNSYNEIQEYSPGGQYLHPGVDLFGDHLENVHSVKYGFVKAILTTSGDYHWRVAIANTNSSADSSQGYLYAHLDQTLIPVLVGDTVAEGEVIGQLVDFPVTGFVHCHFARIVDKGATWSGSWWTFDDPLFYMTNFKDTTAPVFEETIAGQKFAFRDAAGNYLSNEDVQGDVEIISKVYDQINTFWKVDVHRIGYKVGRANLSVLINTDNYSFDFNMFNDTYFNGPYVQDIINTMYSRDATCYSTGNYTDRDFYHILSNSNGDDTITTADDAMTFNTNTLPNGLYALHVWAMDPAGNMSIDSMNFTINNFVGMNAEKKNELSIYPNPASTKVFVKGLSTEIFNTKIPYELFSIEGKKVQSGFLINNYADVSALGNGVYFLKVENAFAKVVISK